MTEQMSDRAAAASRARGSQARYRFMQYDSSTRRGGCALGVWRLALRSRGGLADRSPAEAMVGAVACANRSRPLDRKRCAICRAWTRNRSTCERRPSDIGHPARHCDRWPAFLALARLFNSPPHAWIGLALLMVAGAVALLHLPHSAPLASSPAVSFSSQAHCSLR